MSRRRGRRGESFSQATPSTQPEPRLAPVESWADAPLTHWAAGKVPDTAAWLDGTARARRGDLIGAAVLRLPREVRWALVTRYFLLQGVNEVTRAAHMSPATYRVLLARGLAFVAGYLAGRGVEL